MRMFNICHGRGRGLVGAARLCARARREARKGGGDGARDTGCGGAARECPNARHDQNTAWDAVTNHLSVSSLSIDYPVYLVYLVYLYLVYLSIYIYLSVSISIYLSISLSIDLYLYI